MLKNSENKGTEKIGLVTPTPGTHFRCRTSPWLFYLAFAYWLIWLLPFVTRWKRDEAGEVVKHSSGKPILQFISIQRADTNQWAIPGVSDVTDLSLFSMYCLSALDEDLSRWEMNSQTLWGLRFRYRHFQWTRPPKWKCKVVLMKCCHRKLSKWQFQCSQWRKLRSNENISVSHTVPYQSI